MPLRAAGRGGGHLKWNAWTGWGLAGTSVRHRFDIYVVNATRYYMMNCGMKNTLNVHRATQFDHSVTRLHRMFSNKANIVPDNYLDRTQKTSGVRARAGYVDVPILPHHPWGVL
jgi:hypothetical protein